MLNTKTLETIIDNYVIKDLAIARSVIRIYWKSKPFTQRAFLTEGDARIFVITTVQNLLLCTLPDAKEAVSYLETNGLIQIA